MIQAWSLIGALCFRGVMYEMKFKSGKSTRLGLIRSLKRAVHPLSSISPMRSDSDLRRKEITREKLNGNYY